jgi:fumarate hydratase subunit beta
MTTTPAVEEGVRRLRLPADEESVRALRAGDVVTLDGEAVLCAGMTTHERVLDAVTCGRPLPIDLQAAALLHIGSYSEEHEGRLRIRYLNPTTSTRFDAQMPTIIRALGLRVVGGKGGLNAEGAAALRDVGGIYLSFLGGGCTLLSRAVREVLDVQWNELVPHYRLVKLRVEGLGPAVVGIDSQGHSLYEDLRSGASQRIPQIMAGLASRRAATQSR